MAEHKRISRDRSEESLEKRQTRKKMQQPLHDQIKAADEGVVDFLEPSLEKQATLLANARSDEQRANLITHWQRSYGNSYVQRLLSSRAVQAKLAVNPPDDIYEREADRVANEVTQTPVSEIQRQEEEEELQMKPSSQIQRQEEEEELQMKPTSEVQRQPLEEDEEEIMMKPASEIQRQSLEEEEEPLQGKAANSQAPVSEELERRINTERGSGQALDEHIRSSLEPQFGQDFSQVRIHTDAEANKLSRQLGAEAFTAGQDVFFSEGAYQPDSESGKGLIAHELTHVVQQSAVPVIQRDAVETTSTTATETSATTEAPAGLTGAEARLWRTLVVTPLNQAFEAGTTESPDWSMIAERLYDVRASIEDFTEATSPSPELASGISVIRDNLYTCFMAASSHSTGGDTFLYLLRGALDHATRVGGGGG